MQGKLLCCTLSYRGRACDVTGHCCRTVGGYYVVHSVIEDVHVTSPVTVAGVVGSYCVVRSVIEDVHVTSPVTVAGEVGGYYVVRSVIEGVHVTSPVTVAG